MNNEQFRRLLANDTAKSRDGSLPPKAERNAIPSSLGTRFKSSVPMTPRTLKGTSSLNLARQQAGQNNPQHSQTRFRSSAAPKGTKLATGYHDRTKDRVDGEDDLSKRINALEEQVKSGQLDREIFERLRDEITGGDVSATHLVKGLDRKLLERVRRGENVMVDPTRQPEAEGSLVLGDDEELDRLADSEITAVKREKAVKRGEMAAPPPVAGVKRNRAAILAELKASRKAVAETTAAAEPHLGSRFRKIGFANAPRIEVDDEGREVLLVKGPDGKVKRKYRKVQSTGKDTLLAVDKDAAALGIEQAMLPQKPSLPQTREDGDNAGDDDDDDIFEGVGNDYDPLAELGEEEDDSSDGEGNEIHETTTGQQQLQTSQQSKPQSKDQKTTHSAEPVSNTGTKTRNYFNEPLRSDNVFEAPTNPLKDATILAALQNASRKAERHEADSGNTTNPEEQDRLKRRAAMLKSSDRDFEDMDMGFGSSRFGDAEDVEDNSRIKLSKWNGAGLVDEDGEGSKQRGGKQRKRGSKKRKGDKNSAADVMSVLEKRKG